MNRLYKLECLYLARLVQAIPIFVSKGVDSLNVWATLSKPYPKISDYPEKTFQVQIVHHILSHHQQQNMKVREQNATENALILCCLASLVFAITNKTVNKQDCRQEYSVPTTWCCDFWSEWSIIWIDGNLATKNKNKMKKCCLKDSWQKQFSFNHLVLWL